MLMLLYALVWYCFVADVVIAVGIVGAVDFI